MRGSSSESGRLLDVLAFAVPALSFVEYALVGQLIVVEVVMVALLPWLYRARTRRRVPAWFIWLGLAWLASQMASDIAAGTTSQDYLRGWVAIVITITDVLAIAVLAGTQRRARLFTVGLSASGVLGYFLSPNMYAGQDPWKWGFALPTTFALAAALAGPTASRHPIIRAGAFGVLGLVHLWAGSRALGGVCLVVGAYLALVSFLWRARGSHRPISHPTVAALALAIVGLGVLQLYNAAASAGLLGYEAQVKYQSQSGALGVLLGGRHEPLASLQAIADSPILGHGSWARDGTYVQVLADRMASLGYEPMGLVSDPSALIPAHSFLLGSWVWAGLAGAVFWAAVAFLVSRTLFEGASGATLLLPLVAFTSVDLLWNIAFSPYGSTHRIFASLGIVLCLPFTKRDAGLGGAKTYDTTDGAVRRTEG